MNTASCSNSNSAKARLSIILTAYIFLSLYLLFFHDFKYIIDPDVISYISIAKKYLRGDFANAINGYWSPLVSWLALPLMLAKMRPILAFDLMSVITGGFALVGVDLLLSTIGVRKNIRFFYGLALSPLIAWYALTEGNPDLLCLCILIFYMYVLMREDFKTNTRQGIIAGLLGAVAYLAKSYNFYFFLLHFTFITLLYWCNAVDRNQRKKLVVNGLSGLLVFLMASSVWIGLLTNKYGKLTVSTAGSYSLSFIRPSSPGHMVDTDGLLPPPNKSAFSAWEDPTFIKKPGWSPFRSAGDFGYFVTHTAKNAAIYLLYVSRNHILFFTIIYFVAISISFRPKNKNKIFYLFITTMIHPIGYLMLIVEERYFWIDYILLYVISAYVLQEIMEKANFEKVQRISIYAVILSYIAILPILYISGSENYLNNFRKIYLFSKKIKKFHDFRRDNIASQVDNWCDDLYLSYYLKSRYFGRIRDDITDQRLINKLEKFNIKYLFVHGKLKHNLDILHPEQKIGDITIYEVILPPAVSSG